MKVQKNTVKREVVKREVVSEDVITLELTLEEARMLQAAVGTIGGHVNKNNLRDTTDAIYSNLSSAGIDWFGPEVQKYVKGIESRLRVGEGV